MVGLSVVLEAQKGGHSNKIKNNPQVINKATMSSPSTAVNPGRSSQRFFPAPAFLERCFLCKVKLLPGKDIYMYKGDRAFCSVECRCQQIFMDEEETVRKDQNCSMAAIKPNNPSSSSSTTPSPSPSSSRHRKGGRNHGAGGFAY